MTTRPATPIVLRNCGACGAAPGQMHRPGCDVERCPLCGWQAIACWCDDGGAAADAKVASGELARLPWTGEYPGKAECRELGLWCRTVGSGPACRTEKCAPGDPGAKEDLNELIYAAEWSPEQRKWVKR